MTLVIQAQDIKGVSFGLVENGTLLKNKDLVGEPDRYLAMLEVTLAEWGITAEDLTAVAVVTGPGAFTASRVSTTIANGIAFARQIPLTAVANPERMPLEQLIVSETFTSAKPVDGFAVPVYDRPPHITLPKGTAISH